MPSEDESSSSSNPRNSHSNSSDTNVGDSKGDVVISFFFRYMHVNIFLTAGAVDYREKYVPEVEDFEKMEPTVFPKKEGEDPKGGEIYLYIGKGTFHFFLIFPVAFYFM